MKRMMRVSFAALLSLLLLVANGAAFGQELPPGPKTIYRSSLPGQTIQGEFELLNLVLDFAPGAATPLHTHGGPGIVMVLDGEMVFGVEGKPDQVARPGEFYLDLPGNHHTAANKSANTARVSYTVLLPKGAALTTVNSGGQGGELPPGPKTVHRSSLPGQSVQGELELINLILEFAPGAATPAHTHGGPGIVTVIEGEMVFGVEGKPDQVIRPGEFYLDLPGTAHTAINRSSAPARVSYVVAVPKGAAVTTLVSGAQAPAPAQQPQTAAQPGTESGAPTGMPRTGAQHLPVVLFLILPLLVAGLGAGLRAVRIEGRTRT
jgi:quercetin dioxygenase-like cupin family protein